MPPLASIRTLTDKKKWVPSWILCCAVVAATVVCVSIVCGWELRIPDLEGSSLRPSAARNILFELDLVAVDPLQYIITLDWWIIGDDCNDSAAVSTAQNASCSVVNIYVNLCVFSSHLSLDVYSHRTPSDQFLTAGGSITPSDNGASQPAFQHNPTTLSLSGQAPRPAFRTQLDLRSYPLPNRLNPVDWPFDKYVQQYR